MIPVSTKVLEGVCCWFSSFPSLAPLIFYCFSRLFPVPIFCLSHSIGTIDFSYCQTFIKSVLRRQIAFSHQNTTVKRWTGWNKIGRQNSAQTKQTQKKNKCARAWAQPLPLDSSQRLRTKCGKWLAEERSAASGFTTSTFSTALGLPAPPPPAAPLCKQLSTPRYWPSVFSVSAQLSVVRQSVCALG